MKYIFFLHIMQLRACPLYFVRMRIKIFWLSHWVVSLFLHALLHHLYHFFFPTLLTLFWYLRTSHAFYLATYHFVDECLMVVGSSAEVVAVERLLHWFFDCNNKNQEVIECSRSWVSYSWTVSHSSIYLNGLIQVRNVRKMLALVIHLTNL